jgi:tRNA pseudouridine32 synthase/23S rRNA pseudouridine746 synthase
MPLSKNKFTPFESDITGIPLPNKFTFPFYYDPHPLSLLATEELQHHINTQTEWTHDFGDPEDRESYSIGKMFGVLVVQRQDGEIGYLSAFSGKLADANHHDRFVPPVFDMLQDGNFFIEGMKELNVIQAEVKALESVDGYEEAIQKRKADYQEGQSQIKVLKEKIKKDKAKRKIQRQEAKSNLNSESYNDLVDQLAVESQQSRIHLKNTVKHWNERNKINDLNLSLYTDKIEAAKSRRAAHSANLQQRLFDSYKFLNAESEIKTLNDIFTNIPPTAGAGECAAPKLLQYAFLHKLKPICMAEFWWGKPPKSAIRKHGQFYPACRGKCEPILGHMLVGLEVEENPLLINPGINKKIEIIFEDDYILAINKPPDLLSVPGVIIKDSVSDRIEKMYKDQPGPFVVHRLDMSTSGVMIFSKTRAANRGLQKQFMNRTIKKRYVATLEGYLTQDTGTIDLPIRLDLDDRPKQVVDYVQGKPATTHYEVIEKKNNTTKVYFYPITGRTHQLRVHAAHPDGLNHPIVGDDFYGRKGERLLLHAERIEFLHPISKEEMVIEMKEEF